MAMAMAMALVMRKGTDGQVLTAYGVADSQYDRQQASKTKNRSAVDGTPVSGPGGPLEGDSTILRAPDWPGQNAPAASRPLSIAGFVTFSAPPLPWSGAF
ncbi:hypothetical protein BO71DRAFT_428085 [Aspergillus ellipticus CBS 707.79]|uniref:Uncharacterized protein n=1 Tax=Aspergillus ellipticus CBS 707.79 TaxID=1448320 RepID=A0A319DFV7_9EURO|nr:hypothetical protein BO71DRAFT_428085 [Aspergillus ellipticus CBS 707.79]